MQYADLYTDLNNLLNDENNFALTVDQKNQALTAAFRDKYVVNEVWDGSLTFSVSTYQYALPATITSVAAVYLERDTTLFPTPIDSGLYEVVAGNIQFNQHSQYKIPDNHQLWLRGWYKLTVSDTVTDVALQNYILALAGWTALRNLAYTKLLSFLRNDTSVAEIIAMRNAMQQDVMAYRQQLGTAFVAQ